MMSRIAVVLATLFLASGTLLAAGPSAPAGATFFDNFSKRVARHFEMDRL